MKVYEFAGFPNPARVRIALAEKGLTDRVEFISVDVPNGEHRRSEFLAKNPAGTVPALELDDGTVIGECTAITEYIDHVDGHPSLTGKTARDRGVIHMMQRRMEQGLLDAATDYFHHATPGLGPDLETYQNQSWGEKRRQDAIAGMHYLDRVLGQSPYVAGKEFSMADITAFAGLSFTDFAKIELPPECGNVVAWRERVAARPSIAG